MKTLWGSCNTRDRQIWLNLELAKKPPECLEYVLVHEMVHLLERRHNERFKELMSSAMPQWRLYCDELNRAPLAHGGWDEDGIVGLLASEYAQHGERRIQLQVPACGSVRLVETGHTPYINQ